MEYNYIQSRWECPAPCGFQTRDRLIADLHVCQRPSRPEGEHDQCSWAGCAAGKPLACPKRASGTEGRDA